MTLFSNTISRTKTQQQPLKNGGKYITHLFFSNQMEKYVNKIFRSSKNRPVY